MYELSWKVNVNCGIDGIGVDCAFMGSAVSKVRHDKATIRVRNNAEVLPILPMLTTRNVQRIKGCS